MLKKIVIFLTVPTVLLGMENPVNGGSARIEMHDQVSESGRFQISHLKEKICSSCKNRGCKPQCCVEFDDRWDHPGAGCSCCCVISTAVGTTIVLGLAIFGCAFALSRNH